jgi:hypothetical protein
MSKGRMTAFSDGVLAITAEWSRLESREARAAYIEQIRFSPERGCLVRERGWFHCLSPSLWIEPVLRAGATPRAFRGRRASADGDDMGRREGRMEEAMDTIKSESIRPGTTCEKLR